MGEVQEIIEELERLNTIDKVLNSYPPFGTPEFDDIARKNGKSFNENVRKFRTMVKKDKE